jgi:hypothetical protein
MGALIGSFVPVFGNIVGAGVGAGVGALVGAAAGIYEAVNTLGVSTDQEEKAMLLLSEKYGEIGDAILTEE